MLTIDGESLKIKDVVSVARKHALVGLSPSARERVLASRRVVEEKIGSGEVVYGVNTGFGALKNKVIPREKIVELQKNLLRSHACGVGEELKEEDVRAAMLVRANSLAKGYSGIRPVVINTLCEMLKKKVHPAVPSVGSVGASGDLAPLAHVGLVMVGEGEAYFNDVKMGGGAAMRAARIAPLRLEAKEGLAVINGTSVMAGLGSLLCFDSKNLVASATIAAAMTLEALLGTDKPFDQRVHELRGYAPQSIIAGNLREILRDSEIVKSHSDCDRVQDPYSLRCIPQIHAPAKEAVDSAWKVFENEINAATDNPLVVGGDIICAGNFHGQNIAQALDFLAIGISVLGRASDVRVYKLLDEKQNEGLPAFLVDADKEGLNSGFMIAQYTTAALSSMNSVLSVPASNTSIPTGAGQEDLVSMGMTSALKARKIVYNTEYIISAELLCAAQALDFRRPLAPGVGTQRAFELVRGLVPHLGSDRPLYRDIEKIRGLVRSGKLVSEVERAAGTAFC